MNDKNTEAHERFWEQIEKFYRKKRRGRKGKWSVIVPLKGVAKESAEEKTNKF